MIRGIQDKLKDALDYKRYEHTMGVMYTSAALAMAHNANVEQAMLAGLLHDCAKCISVGKTTELCGKYNVVLNHYEKENPGLIHAKLGAVLAEKIYGVKDTEILNAIIYHTTGKPEMSVLEKIIYLADYIEPHRKTPGVEEIRNLSFSNLDKAMEECSRRTIKHLESISAIIDPTTAATYKYYKNSNNQSSIK